MKEVYFVTGIGTGVGKTVISAILVEALKADYWKPVQAGDLRNSDTIKVKDLISNSTSKFHEEGYKLTKPMSPHAAAERDGVEIRLEDFKLPETDNILVIEGAGGLMVPLNNNHLIIDLIDHFNAKVILVSQNYLGSINHTLLSYEVLTNKSIPIEGIIFNGPENKETEKYILKHTGLPCLLRVLEEEKVTKEMISKYAREWGK